MTAPSRDQHKLELTAVDGACSVHKEPMHDGDNEPAQFRLDGKLTAEMKVPHKPLICLGEGGMEIIGKLGYQSSTGLQKQY